MKAKGNNKNTKLSYECATSDQLYEWRKMARLLAPPKDSWFCTDCTPSYKLEMMRQNRCERPEIKFRRRDDGIEGFVPSRHNRTGELF